jgi:hypothetical protein
MCPPFFDGVRCEIVTDATYVLSGGKDFVIIIIFALAILLILVLVFVVYNRRREAQIKYPNPDDDVRENIINYEDEGGGEDDMTAFDITPLQIPVADPNLMDPNVMVGHHPHHFHSLPRPTKVPQNPNYASMGSATLNPAKMSANVEGFIEDHKQRADNDASAPPFDDLRNYAYEGGGSTAGSLSSLGSGFEREEFGGDEPLKTPSVPPGVPPRGVQPVNPNGGSAHFTARLSELYGTNSSGHL